MNSRCRKNWRGAIVLAFVLGPVWLATEPALAEDLTAADADYGAVFERIAPLPSDGISAKSTVYSRIDKPFFLRGGAPGAGAKAGTILSATALEVIEQTDGGLRVRLHGWAEQGAERAVYEQMGQRILSAVMTPDAVAQASFSEPVMDPETGIAWSPVTVEVWIDPDNLISDRHALWDYGEAMFTAACVNCHSTMAPHDYLANQWIGTLKSMKRYLTLDKQEYRTLLKYVQLHARDTADPDGEEPGNDG